MLPRFIARTHALSTSHPRWRTGVVLTFEGNQALVKATVQDQHVSIAVCGPAAGRRRLLAVIRSDLERMRALERDAACDAEVIPVILWDVNWAGAPFGKPQALPEGGKAVVLWDNRDSAWRSVSEGIEQVVQQIRGGR